MFSAGFSRRRQQRHLNNSSRNNHEARWPVILWRKATSIIVYLCCCGGGAGGLYLWLSQSSNLLIDYYDITASFSNVGSWSSLESQSEQEQYVTIQEQKSPFSSSSQQMAATSISSTSNEKKNPAPLQYPLDYRFVRRRDDSANLNVTAASSSSSSDLHPISNLLLQGRKLFLYELCVRDLGFGSFTMNMILQQLYFQHHHGRILIIDETHCYQYRKNKTHGVYTGFFDYQMAKHGDKKIGSNYGGVGHIIANSKQEFDRIKSEIKPEIVTSNGIKKFDREHPSQDEMERIAFKFTKDSWFTNKYGEEPPWHGYWFRSKTYGDPVIKSTLLQSLKSFGPIRWIAHAYYKLDEKNNLHNKIHVFNELSKLLCHTIPRPNAETMNSIYKLWDDASIPNDAFDINNRNDGGVTSASETSVACPSSPTSAAFHIRRGDKIISESRAYGTMEYVSKLVNDVATTGASDLRPCIKHCFVATDDYGVVEQLSKDLQTNNIPCQLYTLTKPGYETTRKGDDFTVFLAQMELLIRSTYFIGTFNSNVGGLVALYRGCYHGQRRHINIETTRNDPDNHDHGKVFSETLDPLLVSNKLNHYYHSYGVDVDDWYFR